MLPDSCRYSSLSGNRLIQGDFFEDKNREKHGLLIKDLECLQFNGGLGFFVAPLNGDTSWLCKCGLPTHRRFHRGKPQEENKEEGKEEKKQETSLDVEVKEMTDDVAKQEEKGTQEEGAEDKEEGPPPLGVTRWGWLPASTVCRAPRRR